jgi:hypothetical protein
VTLLDLLLIVAAMAIVLMVLAFWMTMRWH